MSETAQQTRHTPGKATVNPDYPTFIEFSDDDVPSAERAAANREKIDDKRNIHEAAIPAAIWRPMSTTAAGSVGPSAITPARGCPSRCSITIIGTPSRSSTPYTVQMLG